MNDVATVAVLGTFLLLIVVSGVALAVMLIEAVREWIRDRRRRRHAADLVLLKAEMDTARRAHLDLVSRMGGR